MLWTDGAKGTLTIFGRGFRLLHHRIHVELIYDTQLSGCKDQQNIANVRMTYQQQTAISYIIAGRTRFLIYHPVNRFDNVQSQQALRRPRSYSYQQT